MKYLILILSLILLFTDCVLARDTYVNGYFKQNGTYVGGHYRTKSNGYLHDNYSTKGNYNPYTYKAGTVNPYKSNNYYNYNSYPKYNTSRRRKYY